MKIPHNIIRKSPVTPPGYPAATRNPMRPPETLDPQAHLAALIQSSDDAIVSKNLDGIIMSWNPAAERMFGFTESEAVGKSIYLIIPEDRKQEEEVVLSRVRSGEGVDHYETIRRR